VRSLIFLRLIIASDSQQIIQGQNHFPALPRSWRFYKKLRTFQAAWEPC